MELFGSSGVRGVVGERLTPTFVTRVAAAAADALGSERWALARDERTSGPALTDAAAAGLAGAGADVDRLGAVPTPGVGYYAESERIPALVITASHNPPEFNGVKLLGPDGGGLEPAALDAVEAAIEGPDYAAWDAVGRSRTIDDAPARYRRALVAGLDAEKIEGARLTVALDPGHGVGTRVTPELLGDLGCTVRTVNAQPDGRFPGRESEPVAKNLGDLRRLVRASDADVGIAHDGDADRAVFVDGEGELIDPAASLAAFAAADLKTGDALVTAVTASQRVVDVCEDARADLDLTPIGATHIAGRVRELRSAGRRVPVAGEGNGGVYFPERVMARDGAYAAGRFLELLADAGSARAVVAPHDGYVTVRGSVPYDDDAEREAMLDAVERKVADVEGEITTIDGHRVDFGDAWVLVRPSGTEPLVRVYAEARERERAESLLEEWLAVLQ
jgi:phosphomannomutase/phosphoglucomutase